MNTKEVILHLEELIIKNTLAHAYIIETNDMEQAFFDLKELVKKIMITKTSSDNLSHLIDTNTLPSLVVISPEDKNIKIDAINTLKERLKTTSVYTDISVYIIKNAERMNSAAFNKILKFLEEPEDNIIGFYLTENKDLMASTIVSRCEILKFIYEKEDNILDSENNLVKIANEYFIKLNNKSNDLIWYNSYVIQKEIPERIDIIKFFQILLNLYKKEFQKTNNKMLIRYIKIVMQYLEKLNYNINISLLLDSFVLEMGGINGV